MFIKTQYSTLVNTDTVIEFSVKKTLNYPERYGVIATILGNKTIRLGEYSSKEQSVDVIENIFNCLETNVTFCVPADDQKECASELSEEDKLILGFGGD